MPLTDVSLRNAKTDRPRKLYDGEGLYLLLNPNGSKWWRFKYCLNGREKLISLGTYPEVSLKAARERRDEAHALVASGGDPSAQRQSEKAARGDTFEALAREWLEIKSKSVEARTLQKKKERFEAFVFPYLGSRPIQTIRAPDFPMLIACSLVFTATFFGALMPTRT
jgi:Arm DNA-binding domain/Phage integrase, N-terminal SAM-like domain